MFSGGARQFGKSLAVAAIAAVGLGSVANAAPPTPRGYRQHHEDRVDANLGYWRYARKGKRTAAQIQRAARKKRNRKRNK